MRPKGLTGLAVWLAAAIVLHDGILAPVAFLADRLLRGVGRRVPAGFGELGRTRFGAFTVILYVAQTPRAVPRLELARAALARGHSAVLVQVRR